MRKPAKVYTREFKINAVRLLETSGRTMSEVARDLDVPSTNLHRWRKEFVRSENFTLWESRIRTTQEEVQRLRLEIEILRQERDVLKRAVGIFSRGVDRM